MNTDLDSDQPDGPDNIAVTPSGGLILAEDGGGLSHVLGVNKKGETFLIARNAVDDTEFTGPTFSPDGRTLFVNIQQPGTTFAISGPWDNPRGLGNNTTNPVTRWPSRGRGSSAPASCAGDLTGRATGRLVNREGARSPAAAMRRRGPSRPRIALRRFATSLTSLHGVSDTVTSIAELGRRAKAASRVLATASTAAKDDALRAAADLLVDRTDEVLAANADRRERGPRPAA